MKQPWVLPVFNTQMNLMANTLIYLWIKSCELSALLDHIKWIRTESIPAMADS